ncbi:MAG: HDIG domain-containing metalloprotein [Verrucomicrobiota bacterium]
MSFLDRLQALFSGSTPRRRRKSAPVNGPAAYFETSRLVASLIFIATVVAIVFISFVGVSSGNLPVLPNQIAPVRIVASVPFSYESAEKTQQLREQIRDRVPPVFRIDMQTYDRFETALRRLLDGFATIDALPAEARPAALAGLRNNFNAAGPSRATLEEIKQLYATGDPAARAALVDNGLAILNSIYRQGVHDDSSLIREPAAGQTEVFQIMRADNDVVQRPADSLEDALTFLRISLATEGGDRARNHALFRFFRNGLSPNLAYDRTATKARQAEASRQLQPVVVRVERNQTIIEPDTRVTPEQYEMLAAHRRALVEEGGALLEEGLQLFGRTLLVLAMVLASLLYIRLEDPETLQSNGRLGLLALIVIINLALVRATYSLGGLPFFMENTGAASVLPYIAPVTIAPLVVAILINAGSAIYMALLIAIFTSVIYGGRIDLLVLTFLSSLVAVHACRQTRRRGNIVRGATLGGLTVAIFALLIGLVDRLPLVTISKYMGAGLITGMACGIIVAGLLPVLEGLFKRTTDITLLELTDYNHPLLRLMQLEAPGTYHHSLVVAQLSENAASAIGANPLLARVCALFHDIGKTKKPEYFIENQRDGINPHDDNNPSLSALIIKSHVKDGVDLALKYKLPRAVIRVIQQHHGTSLIRYFFHRAVHSSRPAATTRPPLPASASKDPFTPSLPGLEPPPVSENTYRYDGPVPDFKESAIIHLADGVEAASRSLRKVSPQHLSELIEQIFRDRLADRQLDDAPITLAELATIKDSFIHTLLNMLHGRIAYPNGEEDDKPVPAATPVPPPPVAPPAPAPAPVAPKPADKPAVV